MTPQKKKSGQIFSGERDILDADLACNENDRHIINHMSRRREAYSLTNYITDTIGRERADIERLSVNDTGKLLLFALMFRAAESIFPVVTERAGGFAYHMGALVENVCTNGGRLFEWIGGTVSTAVNVAAAQLTPEIQNASGNGSAAAAEPTLAAPEGSEPGTTSTTSTTSSTSSTSATVALPASIYSSDPADVLNGIRDRVPGETFTQLLRAAVSRDPTVVMNAINELYSVQEQITDNEYRVICDYLMSVHNKT